MKLECPDCKRSFNTQKRIPLNIPCCGNIICSPCVELMRDPDIANCIKTKCCGDSFFFEKLKQSSFVLDQLRCPKHKEEYTFECQPCKLNFCNKCVNKSEVSCNHDLTKKDIYEKDLRDRFEDLKREIELILQENLEIKEQVSVFLESNLENVVEFFDLQIQKLQVMKNENLKNFKSRNEDKILARLYSEFPEGLDNLKKIVNDFQEIRSSDFSTYTRDQLSFHVDLMRNYRDWTTREKNMELTYQIMKDCIELPKLEEQECKLVTKIKESSIPNQELEKILLDCKTECEDHDQTIIYYNLNTVPSKHLLTFYRTQLPTQNLRLELSPIPEINLRLKASNIIYLTLKLTDKTKNDPDFQLDLFESIQTLTNLNHLGVQFISEKFELFLKSLQKVHRDIRSLKSVAFSFSEKYDSKLIIELLCNLKELKRLEKFDIACHFLDPELYKAIYDLIVTKKKHLIKVSIDDLTKEGRVIDSFKVITKDLLSFKLPSLKVFSLHTNTVSFTKRDVGILASFLKNHNIVILGLTMILPGKSTSESSLTTELWEVVSSNKDLKEFLITTHPGENHICIINYNTIGLLNKLSDLKIQELELSFGNYQSYPSVGNNLNLENFKELKYLSLEFFGDISKEEFASMIENFKSCPKLKEATISITLYKDLKVVIDYANYVRKYPELAKKLTLLVSHENFSEQLKTDFTKDLKYDRLVFSADAVEIKVGYPQENNNGIKFESGLTSPLLEDSESFSLKIPIEMEPESQDISTMSRRLYSDRFN